ERIAIGRGARRARGADGAARAGDVFDDETLAERAFHALADDARERVGSRAGRHPADDRDRPRRIGLCICISDANYEQRDRDREKACHASTSQRPHATAKYGVLGSLRRKKLRCSSDTAADGTIAPPSPRRHASLPGQLKKTNRSPLIEKEACPRRMS